MQHFLFLTSLFFILLTAQNSSYIVFGQNQKFNAENKHLINQAKDDTDANSGKKFPAQEILNFPSSTEVITKNLSSNKTTELKIPAMDITLPVKYCPQWVYEKKIGSINLQLLRFQHANQAYSTYCYLIPPKEKIQKITQNSWLTTEIYTFWIDEEIILLSSTKSNITTESISLADQVHERLKIWHKNLPNYEEVKDKRPFVVRHLPELNLDIATIRYGNAEQLANSTNKEDINYLPMSAGVEIAWGTYLSSSPFKLLRITEYQTPQDTTLAFSVIEDNIKNSQTSEDLKPLVKKRGNFILQVYGVTDLYQANNIIDNIHYDYVVHWIGDKPASMLDPVKENKKIATMLTSIFQLIFVSSIVMIIVGLSAGLGYFIWRKRHTPTTIFSDAGGMVRLNINDNFLTTPTHLPMNKDKNG